MTLNGLRVLVENKVTKINHVQKSTEIFLNNRV